MGAALPPVCGRAEELSSSHKYSIEHACLVASHLAGAAVGTVEGCLYGSIDLLRFALRDGGLTGVLYGLNAVRARHEDFKHDPPRQLKSKDSPGRRLFAVDVFSVDGALQKLEPEKLLPLLRELRASLDKKKWGGGASLPDGGNVDSFVLDDLSDISSGDEADDDE